MARPRRSDVIIPEMPATLHAPCSMREDDPDGRASQSALDSAVDAASWAAIDEKVDGAQLAVRFEGDVPHLRQRNHVMSKSFIARTPHQTQLVPAWEWFHARTKQFRALARCLGYEPVVHGEWLLGAHGVQYDALPALWLAFDVMDERCERFLPHAVAHRALESAGISAVPTLAFGSPCDIAPRLYELSRGPSLLSATGIAREGSYLRLGDDRATTARFKSLPGGIQRGLTLDGMGGYVRNAVRAGQA